MVSAFLCFAADAQFCCCFCSTVTVVLEGRASVADSLDTSLQSAQARDLTRESCHSYHFPSHHEALKIQSQNQSESTSAAMKGKCNLYFGWGCCDLHSFRLITRSQGIIIEE